MATVTIDGNDYAAYQDVDDIDVYAAAATGDNADAWRAADADTKARCAVTATRLLERQSWAGAKTESDQDFAFPRTGLSYADGTEVDSAAIPQQLLDANSELAITLANDSDVQDIASTAPSFKRLKAGSVEIENFGGSQDTGGRFPQIVQELIGLWLAGAGLAVQGVASGVDCKSTLRCGYDLTGSF